MAKEVGMGRWDDEDNLSSKEYNKNGMLWGKEEKDTAPLEMDPTKLNQKGDPLEDFRANKEGAPIGASYDDADPERSEDDDFNSQNDEGRHPWIDVEDLSNEQSLSSYFEGIPSDTTEELIEEFEREESPEEQFELTESAEKGSQEEQKEILPYSVQEFSLLQECAKYNDFLSRLSEDGPRKADGSPITNASGMPITTEEVQAELKRYENYKARKGEWYKIGKAELDRMYQCVMWDAYYGVLAKRRETPKGLDGKPLSMEDAKKIAAEYHWFRSEQPEAFAEQKYQKGEWKKEYFTWQESDYKGRKQWTSSINEAVLKDQGKTVKNKYISNKQPYDLFGKYYYIQRDSKATPDGSIVYRYIDLKYPLPKNIQKIENKKTA